MVGNLYINLEDKELMLKYQDGDHMAFNLLYSRHKDKVYSYLTKRLHSQNDVDDIFQKIFVKFHKSRWIYQKKFEVLPWIYTITRSEFLDFIKKKKTDSVEFREEDHTSQKDSNDQSFASDLDLDFNLDSLNHLSFKEKTALKERYYNDKEFSEIALLLNTSESNTRKIISRSLIKLKTKFKGENNERRL